MSTLDGWTLVTPPSVPPPRTMEITANDTVATSLSPFTAQQQIYDWQAGWMEATISLPPMKRALAEPWIAFLMALHGQANVFQFGDPSATAPRGSAAGSPLVNGAGQTGYALATSGGTGTLLAGDWIQIGYRLYRNLEDVALGSATLNIWPQLRESPDANTAIILTNTQGLWRLRSNARKWTMDEARIYGIQIECREALGVVNSTAESSPALS